MEQLSASPEFPTATESERVLLATEDWLVAYKPHHLLVHRTDWAVHDLENLKDRLLSAGWAHPSTGFLQPVHRLDRPTSGCVLFARTAEAHAALHRAFLAHEVTKSYAAILRGWLPEPEVVVEKPLPTSHSPVPKPARTVFRERARVEVEEAVTRYPTTRLCLVQAFPETGRFHQIRLHAKHLRHPILGDTAHGDRAHNRWMRSAGCDFVLTLHAGALTFPWDGGRVQVQAPFSQPMTEWLERLGFEGFEGIFG